MKMRNINIIIIIIIIIIKNYPPGVAHTHKTFAYNSVTI